MRRKSDTVADHMTTKRLETLDVHQSLEVADDLMALRRIRHLPVVDDGQVVGVVSERDLFRAALVESIRHGWLPAEAMHRVQVVAVMAAPAMPWAGTAQTFARTLSARPPNWIHSLARLSRAATTALSSGEPAWIASTASSSQRRLSPATPAPGTIVSNSRSLHGHTSPQARPPTANRPSRWRASTCRRWTRC